MLTTHVGPIASGYRGPGSPGDPYYKSVSMLLDFEQYSLKDLSSANNSLEVRYAPVPSKISPRFGTQCLAPDPNNNSCVLVPVPATNLNVGSSDFCIEMWVRKSGAPAAVERWAARQATSNAADTRSWVLYYTPTGTLIEFDYSTTGSVSITGAKFTLGTDGVSSATLFDGNWHHIAAVRNGANIYVYVDGFQGGTVKNIGAGVSIWDTANSSIYMTVGGGQTNPTTTLAKATVNIDELRFTIGIPRYTAAFTPPTSAFGTNSTTDPNFAFVKLLLDFEQFFPMSQGGYNTNRMVSMSLWGDTSPIDTNGLLRNSGTNTGPYYATEAGYNFGSGDFTIEAQVNKINANTGNQLGCWSSSAGQRGWRIVRGGAGVGFSFEYTLDGSTTVSASYGFTATDGADYILTVVRYGSNLFLYRNGTRVLSTSISGTLWDVTAAGIPFALMAGVNSSFTGLAGDISGASTRIRYCRITKGVARYTGSVYTLPSLPMPLT